MKLPQFKLTLFLITLFAFSLDQITKFFASNFLIYGIPKNILGDFLRFTYIENPYALFGISLGKEFPYHILTLIVTLIVFLMFILEKDKTLLVAYSLILGGALGNLTDRFLLGGVRDFIDIGFKDLRWPVFNISDTFVTIGIIILAIREFIYFIRKRRVSG